MAENRIVRISTKSDIKKAKFVELWRETKGHISNCCRALGMRRETFYSWLNKDSEFARLLVEAEGELNDDVRDALVQKITDGDMTAIIFYLKNRHPDFKEKKGDTFVDQKILVIPSELISKYGITPNTKDSSG